MLKTGIMKVLIADDHELILSSIRNILMEKLSLSESDISAYTNVEQALTALGSVNYDLYILDLEFDKISGFDLIKTIREQIPESRIIICTMHQEIWTIKRLLDLNLNGIVLKKSANLYMEKAIKAVMNGETFLCPKFQEIRIKSNSFRKKISPPTSRETQVLNHIVEGLTSKEIADKLHITENAVEGHRKNLFLKLNATNVAQLVRNAIIYRLVEI
jgi:Response regulator containing a CheY-like receiver domain and an HTH DNA-binding domain